MSNRGKDHQLCLLLACHEDRAPGSEYCEDHGMKLAIANTAAQFEGDSTLGSLASRILAARKSGLIQQSVGLYPKQG